MRSRPRRPGEPLRVNAFCEREHDYWRVHVHPAGLPDYLASALDDHGEAFPLLLDFDDLDRQLGPVASQCQRHPTRLGSVELDASGDAAEAVAAWLLTSMASGFRPSQG
jgi:hypothetical protein